MSTLGVAIVGCGGITLQNHLPGLALCPDTRVVALCDTNPELLQRASRDTGVTVVSSDYNDVVTRDDVDAVIVATPNIVHGPIAHAAIAAGKHVLCEKPIAMNFEEGREMAVAADKAGVRHMTGFTYRFVPAMQYLSSLVREGALGQPYHFRSCRLQDWGTRALGWRQVAKLAGSGELGDMLSHRIDFAQLLMGRIEGLCANTRRYIDNREGQISDLEDWVAMIVDFASGANGVMESSKVATGRGESWRSRDYVELNGSDASFVFFTGKWSELQIGKPGGSGLETVAIPEKFWKWPGSPRNIREGDPLVTFRYDQSFEFIDAIRNGRPCVPSLHEGAEVLKIMDGALTSARERKWVHFAND